MTEGEGGLMAEAERGWGLDDGRREGGGKERFPSLMHDTTRLWKGTLCTCCVSLTPFDPHATTTTCIHDGKGNTNFMTKSMSCVCCVVLTPFDNVSKNKKSVGVPSLPGCQHKKQAQTDQPQGWNTPKMYSSSTRASNIM